MRRSVDLGLDGFADGGFVPGGPDEYIAIPNLLKMGDVELKDDPKSQAEEILNDASVPGGGLERRPCMPTAGLPTKKIA